jgi:hypothetical protein
MSLLNGIISRGVGWLALLIFTKGQCEGLKTGISEETNSRVFFVSETLNIINNCRVLGVYRH